MKSTTTDCLVEAWEVILRGRNWEGEAPAEPRSREGHGSAGASPSQGKQRPAIFGTSGEVLRTFAQIEAEACEFEQRLFREFRPGDVIAIQVGNHAAWPALLLACLRRGLVALPLERTMATREREAALLICRAAAVIVIESEREEIALTPLAHEPVAWTPMAPSLLKLTSGTTAAPRAIRFRSEQLLADCAQICETMGITERDRNFAVIPLSHSYGFSNLVTPLLARGVPMVLSRDRMPRAVLDDLARTNATVFPGMPVFYQAFSEMNEAPALPQLRLCISAGAPLPLEVAKKFRERFKQSIHSFYGSSECGGICYDRTALLLEPGFVGGPMRGIELEAMEPGACATRVRVRSAAAGDGYFPDRDEEKLGGGTFVPDDLLSATGDGFRIVGRTSDVINVAGKKVNPAEVEAELLRFAGVRAAVVFGRESILRNEEVAACVVAGEGISESDLLEFCRGRLSGWQVPKRIFVVEEIPVNERGKINRRELAAKFRS
ncbi:MAG TPA: class I adenylate-forming enzyme family protein [Chthoniobacterales bacterium]|nr:class I adenylate-forming enzyme family protein [Chthoniobacterales bacterium]